ncbi:MAG: hypothetical protein D6728_05000 [Cyanobacteria bacterium J055]|nr:MAG: hypothetical protein D6728_05000 [Cyanobacteria bacterium J055]
MGDWELTNPKGLMTDKKNQLALGSKLGESSMTTLFFRKIDFCLRVAAYLKLSNSVIFIPLVN